MTRIDGSARFFPKVFDTTAASCSVIHMTTTETRIVKTYIGRNRMPVWAVREYTVYGDVEVYETLGRYASETQARAHA